MREAKTRKGGDRAREGNGMVPGPEAAAAAAVAALSADKRSHRLGAARRKDKAVRDTGATRRRGASGESEPRVFLQDWVNLETLFPQIR